MSEPAVEAAATASSTAGDHRVLCRLDSLLLEREMTLTELSRRTGVTMANLSVLKTNKARAVRFTTLTAICDALGVGVGDLLEVDHRTASREPEHERVQVSRVEPDEASRQ